MRSFSLRAISLGFSVLCILALFAIYEVTAQPKTNKTIGPGSCGAGQDNCHKGTFSGWYDNDPHSKTIDKLYDKEAVSTQYAKEFGLDMETLFNGSSMCMDCHGTQKTGSENDYTEDGVSCESCHGPGDLYLVGHEVGDAAGKRTRAGYLDALSKGLLKLEDPNILAKNCVDCHLTTDEKLLRAGHSNGARFSYKSGLATVANPAHWKRYKATDKRKDKFDAAAMALVNKNKVSVTFAAAPAPSGNQQGASIRRVVDTVYISSGGGAASGKPVVLPPFPLLSDSLSFEQIMLLIAKRIEVVGKSIGTRK